MHGDQNVRRRFADLDTEPLHVLRQSRQRVLDTVLREHLRHVQVGADPERHRDGQFAVARRLAADVEHILHTVDLLLERSRDCFGNSFGGCSRVCRRDLHGRRNNLRVLGNGQDQQRAQPDEGDENADHGRENRPVDKSV